MLLITEQNEALKNALEQTKRDPKGFTTVENIRKVSKYLGEQRSKGVVVPNLRDLLGNCRLVYQDPGAEQHVRNPELDKRRKYLQRLQEEKIYGKMVKRIARGPADSEIQREMKSAKQHMSIGVNVIVSKITAFIALYMVSRSVTTNETLRILAGLAGAIVMMLIEMMLHIVRDSQLQNAGRKLRRLDERRLRQSS